MLEKSIESIEWVIKRLEEQKQINEQLIERQKKRTDDARSRLQRIIDDPKASPVEQLRALVVNTIEADESLQLGRMRSQLLLDDMLTISMRMFQEEVAYELNLHKAQTILQTLPKSEEQLRLAKMDEELQNVKQTIENEWKPLMDKIKEKIDQRKDVLDKNR